MTHKAILGMASLMLLAACSKTPANNTDSAAASASAAAASAATAAASAAPAAQPAGAVGVSGAFTVDGKGATLTQVSTKKDDPFDGQPITDVVITEKDQGGDPDAATNALFGKYGDAIVAKV